LFVTGKKRHPSLVELINDMMGQNLNIPNWASQMQMVARNRTTPSDPMEKKKPLKIKS